MFGLIPYDTRWMDTAFDRLFSDFAPALPAFSEGMFSPRVDIREDADALVLSAELPGIEKDAVNVEVHKGVLTISGEKKSEKAEEKGGYYRSERVYGSFKRSFRLPETVDGDNVQATYKEGVLTVRLAKRPDSKPRTIEVKN